MLKATFTTVNHAIRFALIACIRGYRYCLSPLLGNCCRFYPSCSCYAETALQRFGIVKGTGLVVYRLLRCHPYHPGGYDPVPKKNKKQMV